MADSVNDTNFAYEPHTILKAQNIEVLRMVVSVRRMVYHFSMALRIKRSLHFEYSTCTQYIKYEYNVRANASSEAS